MNTIVAKLCWMSAALPLFAGCGTDLEATNTEAPPTAEKALAPRAVSLPEQLSCVSAAFTSPTRVMPHVVRFELTLTNASYHGTTTTGLQFPSHSGDAAAVAGRPRAQTLRAHTTAAGTLILESTAATSLRVSLTRDGIAWKGTYVDTSASKQSRGLTCWSAADLTPSRIGRRNPALPAHFDWTKHKCVDTRGRAAHNRIPIEVIRETTFGECADLSGVSLNGGDLGYPELLYWQLMGAKLGGATLHFANLRGASLQGADLGALDFGYARVQGVIDDATLLPTSQGGTCSLTSSPWAGKSCDCLR